MLTVRRLYLYSVSGLALGLLIVGLIGLTRLVLDQLGFGPAAGLIGGSPDRTREDLSLGVALVLVGLPLWLVHTWYVERLVRRPDAAGEVERQSDLRALYLSIVLGIILWIGATSAADAIREGLRGLVLTTSGDYYADIPGSIATALIVLPLWAYTAWTRRRDLASGPLRRAAASISRLELYGAAFVGAIAALWAIGDLITTVLRLAVGRPPVVIDDGWWQIALGGAIAQGLVGGVVWWTHWRYSVGLVGGAGARGSDIGEPAGAAIGPVAAEERASRVRVAHLCALALAGVAYATVAAAASLDALIAYGFGVAESSDLLRLVEDVVAPLLTATPFVVAAAWASRVAERESLAFGGELRAFATHRLIRVLLALVGLTLVGVGLAWTLGIAFDVLLGGSRTVASGETQWRRELAQFASFAILGLPLWLVPWHRLQTMFATDPAREAASTTRRAYLSLVGGVTLTAAASSLAFLLYRMIRMIVGLDVASLGSDVSAPLAIIVVAGALLGFHGAVLRGDVGLRAPVEREATTAPARPPDEGPGEPAPVRLAEEELVIVGPPGADLDALGTTLRERLPEGFSVRVRARPDD